MTRRPHILQGCIAWDAGFSAPPPQRVVTALGRVGKGNACFLGSGAPTRPLAGGGVVIAEARLDNREEVARRLGVDSPGAPEVPDDVLLARAFEAWGADCGRHLLGAWAFAAWQEVGGPLTLGRDALGAASLYYHVTPTHLYFASRLPALLALIPTPHRLDRVALAQLTLGGKRDTRTFYHGVHKAPPAQVLVFEGGAEPRRHRYWDPGDATPVRLPTDAAYREAFLAVYDEAVACRLHGDGPVGIALSGGLDSGSVAALAAPRLAARGDILHAYTWVPSHELSPDRFEGRTANELDNARALARFVGNIEVTPVRGYPLGPLGAVRRMLDVTEEPTNAVAGWSWYHGVWARAANDGVPTLLSGELGNYTVSLDRMDTRPRGDRWTRRLRLRLKTALTGTPSHPRLLVRPSFADIILRAAEPSDPWLTGRWREASQPLRSFYNVMQSGGFTESREVAADMGVDLRVPPLDRRLVEFCLGLPPEQFARDGQTKLLVRHAMSGRMPHDRLWDEARGRLAGDLAIALAAERDDMQEILDTSGRTPLARAALDLDYLNTAARRLLHDPGAVDPRDAVLLMRGLTYALFLQRFDDLAEPA